MARTNSDLVQQILAPGGDYDGVSNLGVFVAAANVMTNKLASLATANSSALSDEQLLAIEGFVAAHFYKMSDRQQSAKTIGRTSNTYGTKMDMGLEGTTYGQCAISLDPTGLLKLLGSGDLAKNTASIGYYHPDCRDTSHPGD